MIRIGEVIDRYIIEERLGQGGMAAVYRARHNTLESVHAIKVLFITAPDVRQRLMREGRVQANLKHPNILAVSDILEHRGVPALVMEFVEGPSLDAWLASNEPTTEEALFLFRGILRGVMAAHERGVIHRDLKPANVLLAPTSEGVVPKVADFGLTKSLSPASGSTRTGMAMGTPEYMAPEQIRDSSDVDQRVDVFALGCILFELTTGQRAFLGDDNMMIFNRIVDGEYPNPIELKPDIPTAIVDAIHRCLEPDRAKRLDSTSRLFELLFDSDTSMNLNVTTSNGAPIRISGTMPDARGLKAANQSKATTVPPGSSQAKTQPSIEEGNAFPPLPPTASPVAPSPPVMVPKQPPLGPWLLAVGVVATIALGLGYTVAPVFGTGQQDAAPSLPTPATLSPDIQVEPGDLESAPQPAEPTPTVRTPEPPSKPAPVEPDLPADAPTPEPQAGPLEVSVGVEGNASGAWLFAEDGSKTTLPGSVPPGTFRIEADFGSGPVGAGTVSIREGQPVSLNCDAFFNQCRPR